MRHMQYLRWLPVALALVAAPRMADAQKPAVAQKPPGYAGMAACVDCHKENVEAFNNSLHGKAADPRTPAAALGCETCHGPGAKHAENPDEPIRGFKNLSPDAVTAVCTSCHASGEHALWAGSKHEARGVACTTCHSVHHSKGAHLVKTEKQAQLCANCHRNIVNKLNRFNHMPVREDKLVCTNCHNAHGSANVKLLRAGTTIDETCTSCHSEKRGPYLWEHAPVANSCTTCHDPHGSSNERMLVAKVPFLCQRCHVTSRHPPTVYSQWSIENSTNASRIQSRGCIICHAQIHGSNSPSGQRFLR